MTKMDHMNYLPLGAHRTNKGAPAYAYLRTPARPGQTPQGGRILLFEEPWPAELDSKLMVSEDGWNKSVGTIAWSSGETTGLNVPKQAQHKGYGALLVELALQCNPDLRDDGKVTTEGQGLLATLGLRASNAPVAESATPPAPAPAAVLHSTQAGVWLVADTDQGRELMHQVPDRPAMWQLDAAQEPSTGAGRAYGILALAAVALLMIGIASDHWSAGAIMAGIPVLVMVLLDVLRRSATRVWQRMQDSALAVPAPLELWSETERQQLRRRRRVTPGRLESLPMLNGMSALSLLWQAGQGGATAAALDALGVPHTRTFPAAIERRRQREVMEEILGK